VEAICNVLGGAFSPFRDAYTKHAYDATAIGRDEIERRIRDPRIDVLVAISGKTIVGTVTVEPKGAGGLYIRSMAVRPDHQGRHIGALIVETIERNARAAGLDHLSLECYQALDAAMALYERSGFKPTGRTRDYGGITVFEMLKML
jgi:GNAT superfamily N-acetyltransferase